MGSHVFQWPHAATEVYVTGTFDDWGKTVKLEKAGNVFEKDVQLAKADEKIYYKFVVDGDWVLDHDGPKEDDGSGNINNVLKPEEIKKPVMESSEKQSPPGAFPETPANEAQEFSVKPIPASEGAGNPVQATPGETLPEHTGNINANVTTSQEDYEKAGEPEAQEFSVKPIPASEGVGNPVHLDAGEKVPEHDGDVNANATTSKEDYENAGSAALPAAAAAVAAGTAAEEFSVPEKSKNMIPESSLPVESANGTVQSSGAGTTTAELAGQQPLEPRREATVVGGEDEVAAAAVPETVKESIAESHEAPEAAANAEAVEEKKEVEAELLKEIKPAEATGEPEAAAAEPAMLSAGALASDVPEPVKESIEEAKQDPEATTNPEAVAEKKEVEAELLSEVKTTDAVGEPAPTAAAATSETAPAPTAASEPEPATAAAPEVPTVTTGVASATTEETSTPKEAVAAPEETPAAAATEEPSITTGVDSAKTEEKSTPTKSVKMAEPESSTPTSTDDAAKDDKKKKRRSFFGKLKEKFK